MSTEARVVQASEGGPLSRSLTTAVSKRTAPFSLASSWRLPNVPEIWIATFAEGLAMALEHSELTERIRIHEAKMRELLSTGIGLFDELVEDTVDFTRPSPTGEPASPAQQELRRLDRAAQTGALSLLTRREIEVLDMIASGATNVAIGEALFITEVTVKSHVQHILRKLRASNRAEAVARYLRARRIADSTLDT